MYDIDGEIYRTLKNITNNKSSDSNTVIDRKESSITEYDLEKELETYRNNMYNEVDMFEESLKASNNNKNIYDTTCMSAIYDLQFNDAKISYGSSYINGTPIYNDTKTFDVMKSGDYVDTIYLEIDIGKPFSELLAEDKHNLLDLDILLFIGRIQIAHGSLMTLLLQQICINKVINETETTIQIPIFSFENMKTGLYHGFPLIIGSSLKVSISRISKNLELLKSMRLLVTYVLQNSQDRITCMIDNKYKALCLQSYKIYNYNNYKDSTLSSTLSYFNGCTKAMLLYFRPKNIDNLYTHPNLTQITFKLINNDGRVTYEEFNIDNLNSIEILGVSVYILSFSKEFDSIEALCKTLQNPSQEMSPTGINFTTYKQVTINIECVDDLENYFINLHNISMDILQKCNGELKLM